MRFNEINEIDEKSTERPLDYWKNNPIDGDNNHLRFNEINNEVDGDIWSKTSDFPENNELSTFIYSFWRS